MDLTNRAGLGLSGSGRGHHNIDAIGDMDLTNRAGLGLSGSEKGLHNISAIGDSDLTNRAGLGLSGSCINRAGLGLSGSCINRAGLGLSGSGTDRSDADRRHRRRSPGEKLHYMVRNLAAVMLVKTSNSSFQHCWVRGALPPTSTIRSSADHFHKR